MHSIANISNYSNYFPKHSFIHVLMNNCTATVWGFQLFEEIIECHKKQWGCVKPNYKQTCKCTVEGRRKMVKLTLTAWSWANSPSCNNPETTFSVGKKATVTLPSTSGDTPWKEKKGINTNCQTTLFFYMKINLWFLFKNYSTLLNFVNVKIKASIAIYSNKT